MIMDYKLFNKKKNDLNKFVSKWCAIFIFSFNQQVEL